MIGKPAMAIGAMVSVVAISCTSCGIGPQATAQRLDPARVPFHLLSPASTIPAPPTSGATVEVYFEGLGGLVQAPRRTGGLADVATALSELSRGPDAAESAAGVTSPASAASPIRLGSLRGGIATVDVPASFATLGGQEEVIAAAQIVFTATAVAGVSAVSLTVAGQPAEVPTEDGTLASGPLTRTQYAALLGAH